ncbi:TetR/AcrR family transcriptional regulator [Nocardioides daeguensis]|uniref:TetR family transcriptional regulator n=1 Tax=Nocardioides daeguensis TaxID=908359 RepID=A0ABP6VDJ6_9ACTN|nr:TetR/AcrR family transcriptional regulator [Nocardioides daeguensis]MBV6729539.1 TetR/AcrR family transcriptional regulator [Nocardioides daeguensis]MCR1771688.1 TetR/AcrR family transcriptional regulator [Nocardioides daeguensis]
MSTVRRTQQERSAATRAKLLEAAYASLLERGYGATTVGEVQQRAGVARGTLLHHFPTRGSLMAGVVEDVVERRLRVLTAPGPDAGSAAASWGEMVDLVWDELRQPPFAVALELWVAARTDPDLRQALLPLQERIYGTVHRSVTRLAGDDHPRAPMLVQFTIDLLTGSHLAGILRPRAGTSAVVEAWKVAVQELARREA